MKILFIRSNPVSPDPRVEKEALALGMMGNKVDVLAWDRDNINAKFEQRDYYVVHRFGLKADYGNPLLIFKLFIWWIYEFFYLIRAKYDIIHACDLDTLIVAAFVSKLRNKKLIYDCFDFYSDSLPSIFPNIVRNIVSRIERFFATFAHTVILVDESRIIQFRNKIKNSVIVYNTPPDALILFNQSHHDENRKEFLIFYAGILDENRGFRKIIEATEDLKDIQIIIAGFGADERTLVDLFKNTTNIKYIGKIPYKDVIGYTRDSGMLFALYDPKIPNHRYASPNKIFEAMMCGKPIIVSAETSMANIVEKEKCGIVVPYGDVQKIRETIIMLKNDLDLRRRLGENGRRAYEERYGWKRMENKLLDAYEFLMNTQNI